MRKATEGSLEVRHRYAHPPERVFDAWTDAEGMRAWMRPGPTTDVRTRLDVRVGGTFMITMVFGDSAIEHTGEYLEVDRPRRLAFTWMAEHFDAPTHVTIEFKAVDGGTEVVLVHEGLPSEESVTNHTDGWGTILELLEAALGRTR
jgi:uncharacterized protein YndB with AHSA1/START domain